MRNLKRSRFLIVNFVDPSFVEREDLGHRIGEQYRRVSWDDELRVLELAQNVVNQDQERELPLGDSAASGSSSRNNPLRRNLRSSTVKNVSPCERVWRLRPP